MTPDLPSFRAPSTRAAVIAAAADGAAAAGLPRDAVADLWERLVEASIAYELVEWDRLRA